MKCWPPAAGGPQRRGAGGWGRERSCTLCQHSATVTLPAGGWKHAARAHRERGEPQGAASPSPGAGTAQGSRAVKPWLLDSSIMLETIHPPHADALGVGGLLPATPGSQEKGLWPQQRSRGAKSGNQRGLQAERTPGPCQQGATPSPMPSHGLANVPVPARTSARQLCARRVHSWSCWSCALACTSACGCPSSESAACPPSGPGRHRNPPCSAQGSACSHPPHTG